MKILFIQRPDANTKHGGDHSLLLYYKVLIEKKLGFQCDIYNDELELDKFDYVFFFNIDRPMNYIHLVELCIKKNIPYVIYTLHHPEKGISNYLRYGTFGIRRFFSKLSKFNPIIYEQYLSIAKSLINVSLRSDYNIRKIQKKIITNAKYVLTSSNLESLEIQKDIEAGNFIILPHYYEKKICNEPKIKNLIVCAGRIESRKNQIDVLNIAYLNPDKKFVFVGNFNETDSKYINEFKEKQKKLTNVKVVSGLDKNEYYQYLCKAEVFISLSYFEVVSLVELDAFSAGCKMIIGKHSYIKEFIYGEDIQTLDYKDYKNLNHYLKTISNVEVNRNYENLSLMSEDNISNILSKIFS